MLKNRILYIMPSLSGGGAEKVLIDVLKYTDYSKYDVDLCLIINRGVYLDEIPSFVNRKCVYCENDGLLYKLHFVLAKYFNISCFQLYRINRVVEQNYDVIISFMEGISVKFHSYVLNKGRTNVSWIHIDLLTKHYTNHYFYSFLEERSIYKRMDKIAFVSDDAKRGFVKLFNVDGQLTTIYNPIDRENIVLLSKKNVIDKNRFTICSVGRLMPQKAYDRMVRLAYHLKKNNVDVDFWILGTGYLEAELRRLARDLSVEDMVHFLGFKSNPYPYIAASDLFLSTSMTEGYPLVICEALCLGKPIIATAVSGSKEILADSEYGLLSEEDDDSLLKNTLRMITNNSLREYYSNRAVEKSLDFDVQSTVDNIYKFIKQ